MTVSWNQAADRYDIFYDGIKQSVSQLNSQHHVGLMSSENVNIGTPNRISFYDGLFDEVRISDISRNSHWIATEYINQIDSENFITIGPEESGP